MIGTRPGTGRELVRILVGNQSGARRGWSGERGAIGMGRIPVVGACKGTLTRATAGRRLLQSSLPPWNVGAALQTDHPACNRNVQGGEGATAGVPARWRRRGEVECAAASGLEALLCNMVDTVKAAVEEISAGLEDGTAAAPGGGPLCASRR